MKRKRSLKALTRDLDQAFSRFIRRRDADDNGIGRCISCGVYAELQAGHFIKRQHRIYRWDEKNVHGQCVRCNHYLGGNDGAYGIALAKRYGVYAVEAMLSAKHTQKKFTRTDLEEMLSKYDGPSSR